MPPDSLLPVGAPKSGKSSHTSVIQSPHNVQQPQPSRLRSGIRRLSFAFEVSFLAQFSSVAHHGWLFATPWTAACQASLSITNSWSLFKLMSIESHLVFIFIYLVAPGLSCMWDLSWGTQNLLVVAWSTCHSWPDQGWNQGPLYWERGVLASGPQGKSPKGFWRD